MSESGLPPSDSGLPPSDSRLPPLTPVPLVTSDVPGVGGGLKRSPEDFRVEELPLYEASGEGEHLYLTIEKRGVTTLDMIDRVGRALGVKPGQIGYAGMKDAKAVTTQRISIAGVDETAVSSLELSGIRVLECRRHRNKLKRGHLRGNRFKIVVRGVRDGADTAARQVLSTLERRGVPNGFGPQRFGNRGDTHELGRAVLMGDGRGFFEVLLSAPSAADSLERLLSGDVAGAVDGLPDSHRMERKTVLSVNRSGGDLDRAVAYLPKPLRSLYLSALQSAVFNELLVRRFPEYERIRTGDLAWLHRNGAVFTVEDAAAEASRVAAHEISPSGPLFGSKVSLPESPMREFEVGVLEGLGLDLERFSARRDLRGARRPLRVPLADPEARQVGEDLEVSFSLPPGSYATVVLREIQEGG